MKIVEAVQVPSRDFQFENGEVVLISCAFLVKPFCDGANDRLIGPVVVVGEDLLKREVGVASY